MKGGISMDISNNKGTHTRRPLLASLLSVVSPGLGHIYCGKLAKGLSLFFLGFVFIPIIVFSAKNVSSTFVLIAYIASIVLLIVVFFYAIVDAWILAKRIGSRYTIKEYNKWYLYVLFIVVALSFPSNLSHSIRENIFQVFRMPSIIMLPNLLVGDHVILNKTAYRNQPPTNGDVIIFKHPNARHWNWVGRIVAMPGETIEIKDNVLYIDDVPLQYRKVESDTLSAIKNQISHEVVEEVNSLVSYKIMLYRHIPSNFEKTKIPNGHCFVIVDNRNKWLRDSRHFGPVPLADVQGRLDYIYFPAESWSRFGKFQ